MSILKKIILLLLVLPLSLLAKDIVVYENEYLVLPLEKRVKKLIVGNKDIINVSMLKGVSKAQKRLKLFGKKSGNTSILLVNSDGTLDNFHVYVNQNLGYIQKMINVIEPNLSLSKVGDGSTVISGKFKDPHEKNRVYSLLEHAGIDLEKLMDVTQTEKINKMIRTKLYLVEINNNRAKDLGGVTGLGYTSDNLNIGVNAGATNSATFSGWLLNNDGSFSNNNGHSGLIASLNFLETKGVAKILDDTVLITTEDKNASFHVGGEVYIPVGMTQTNGGYPTIQLEEKEYGLRLTLTTAFLEKEGFMHMNISIVDSEFDPNEEHNVQLGAGGFGSEPIEVPSFLSKHIDTDVVSKSGALVTLGGRLHTEEVESEEKIPLLGDIPWLGELFKRTVKSNKQNDLLFFLVPEIVDANEDINDTKFYKEFKNHAQKLHEVILDTNTSEDDIEVEELIIADTSNDEVLIEDTDGAVIDNSVDVEVAEEVVVEEETSVEDVVPKEETVVEEVDAREADEENEKPELIQAQVIEQPVEVQREIDTQQIFIRSSPTNGKRVQVWVQGHKFVPGEDVTEDGLTWTKIIKDCQNEVCVDVDEELWVSKKYTR